LQYLSQPSQFRASNVHTDVRLVLGWTSSLIAIGAALYAYKVGKFQETRPVVISAVVVFVFLTAVMNLYAKYVEKDVVFVGRRKVFAGRVSAGRKP
jgi:signal peptidase complex subunit 2